MWQNRIIGHGEESPESLLANPFNFRVHGKKQQEWAHASLEELGWIDEVKVNKNTGRMVDGHLRVIMAMRYNQSVIPVTYLDLTEQEELKALTIYDRITSMATIDDDILKELVGELKIDPNDFLAPSLNEIKGEIGLLKPDETINEPASPEQLLSQSGELISKWRPDIGVVWRIGPHRLMCGDSTDEEHVAALLGGEECKTVFFDPPFNAPDNVTGLRWECDDALVFANPFYALNYTDKWGRFRCLFIWDCGQCAFVSDSKPLLNAKICYWFGESEYNYQGAFYGVTDGKARHIKNKWGEYDYIPDPRGKQLATVYHEPISSKFKHHNHAKPVPWIKMMIANCTRGNLFDPFGGGGSSMIAATELGRRCFMMELEVANTAVILERCANAGLEVMRL